MKKTIFYSTLPLIFSSCVLQTKYDALMNQKEEARTEAQTCSDALQVSDTENQQLREENGELLALSTDLGKKLTSCQSRFDKKQEAFGSLEKLYQQSIASKGKISRNYEDQQRYLNGVRSDLERTRVQNESLSRDLESRERRNQELARSLQARENRVRELERLIAQQRAKAETLQEKAKQALESLSSADFSVEIRNGEVYVSLSEKLLFQSGKSNINALGADALEQLALALQMQKNFEIVIEGHTDADPITKISDYMKDNWDLSVIRATSVTRILVQNGVDPGIIHASGRGEFSPKERNDTQEGKQQNRRIEIILKPTLKEFYQVLGSNS